ncbi:MAG: hypothetical protein HY673_14330 [Chloroflexi bacterium]|nr:hypothetical protein [Chloroflexota bacterium]
MHRIAISFLLAAFLVWLSACEAPRATPAVTLKPTAPPATASPAPATKSAETPGAGARPTTPPSLPTAAPTPSPAPKPSPKPATPAPTVGAEPGPEPAATTRPPPPAPPAPSFLKKGETLPAVAAKSGRRSLDFTFLWWNAGDRAVSPVLGRNYTFVARPGMKFIIVSYRFKNAFNVEEETPDINAGTMLTLPRGYAYELWMTPSPSDALYRVHESLPGEVAVLGATTGGSVKLLPGQTADGRVIFEMPAEMSPVEASLSRIPERITFVDQSVSQTVPATPAPGPSAAYLKKGETLGAVAARSGRPGLRFTFLWWSVTDRAVAFSQGANYTYVARPGMKFIIVNYRFTNVSGAEEDTPDVNAGKIVTQPRGFSYQLWLPPPAAEAQSYRVQPAFPREVVELGASSGGGVRLKPEQSADGRAAFEIPAEMVPTEVSLGGIPAPILLTE